MVLSSFTIMQNMTVPVVDMNSAIVPAHWLMTNVCFTSACTSSGTSAMSDETHTAKTNAESRPMF